MIRPLRQTEMLERAQGCLLGQLAGDALGSRVEFQTPEQIRREYPDGVGELAEAPPADYVHRQGWVLTAFRNALWQLLHAPNPEEADIGCGTGASTILLVEELDAEITAVDFLPEFLDELQTRAKEHGERLSASLLNTGRRERNETQTSPPQTDFRRERG